MPHDRSQDLSRLHEFFNEICTQLEVTEEQVPVDEILGLASVTARSVMRPGVPVAAFVAGILAGRGATSAEAIARLQGLAEAYAEVHGPDPARRH